MKKIILFSLLITFFNSAFSQHHYKIFRSIAVQHDSTINTWKSIPGQDLDDSTLFSITLDTLDLHRVKKIIVNHKGQKQVFECPPIAKHFVSNNFNIYKYYKVRVKGTNKTCTIQFEQQPSDGRTILDIFYDDDKDIGYALFYNFKNKHGYIDDFVQTMLNELH
jgi:hypothetical protein